VTRTQRVSTILIVITCLFNGVSGVSAQQTVAVKVLIVDTTTDAPITAGADVFSRHDCATWNSSCQELAAQQPGHIDPVAVKCTSGFAIYARPRGYNYYAESTPEVCIRGTDALRLKVTQINDSAWMSKVGHDLFSQGNYQEAAIFLSAANSQDPSPKNAEGAIAAIGLQLGIPEDKSLSFDQQQGYKVATPELVAALKSFQKKNSLPADGVAGSATLQKLFDGKNFYAAFSERAKANAVP
jgi:hypothetical protein